MPINWDDYRNFDKEEFDCSHTGKNRMRPEFLDLLQQGRDIYGKPMIITSGYRDPSHPIEIQKRTAGEHTYGVAADVAGSPEDLLDLMIIMYGLGVRRFGIDFKRKFLHIGIGDKNLGFAPTPWTY